jgi:lipopolysaccharide/colanic/teichoic acid biosynthesis glycosyltransferase
MGEASLRWAYRVVCRARHVAVGWVPSWDRLVDVVVASVLLVLLAPVAVLVAGAIKVDSSGPAFYRCRRVGAHGREFFMLKFRKMKDGVSGLPLTTSDDERFTRVGGLLAASKLDELPQLWNVLRGDMSLVGPRPEAPEFVALAPSDYAVILSVRPGITGLSQLAYANENALLDGMDPVADYVARIFPQKLLLDRLYVTRRSFALDAMIFAWTLALLLLGREVAVDRTTAELTPRQPRIPELVFEKATS